MRQSSQKFGQLSQKFGQLSFSQEFGERIAQFLRGRHPVKTAEMVAADVPGLAPVQVRKWLDRGSLPSLPAMISLVAAYGPDFLAALMSRPPDWLLAAQDGAARERVAADLQRLAEQISELESRL